MSEKKVTVISDTTSDLSDELIEQYGIKLIPLYVTLGDKTLKDKLEISPEDIYANYDKTGQLPKTSAASVEDHRLMMEKYTADGSGLVYFTISSQMSCSFNNARLAAEEFEDVYVIDSANLSTGIGLMVLRAADMAQQGCTAKEIYDEIEAIKPRVDSSFVVDSLEYLKKGGRCSTVAALGANLLKLHPCIVVRNGAMSVSKKYKGNMKSVLLQYTENMLAELDNIENDRVFITHSGCDPEILNAVHELVASKGHFKDILVTKAGSVISSHCGYGTLGVLFIRKSNVV